MACVPWDDDQDEPDEDWPAPSLGPCCACEQAGPTVRNIMMLGQRSPIAGRGWGCLECGASLDGALAVVCDRCLEAEAPLRFACRGWPGADGRVPIAALAGVHQHDRRLHAEE